MTALLDLVLESHGTLERWRKFNAIDVNLSMHGSHWTRKGWDGVFENVQLKAQTKEQRTCFTHFTEEGVQSIYEPDRVRLETIDGKLIEERVHKMRLKDILFRRRGIGCIWLTLPGMHFGII